MTKSNKIRVFIADDFPLLRRVMGEVIDGTGDMEVVGETGNIEDAVAELQMLQPDVILVADNLPAANSTYANRLIRKSGITAAVLIISTYIEAELIERGFASGVNGFIRKDEIGTLLIEAIRTVFHHQEYLSPEAANILTGPII